MIALLRFVARRVAGRAAARSRWVSRVLVVVSVVRWWNNRPRGRRVVTVGRGETLIVGLEQGGRPR